MRQKGWDQGDELSKIDAQLHVDEKQLQARKATDKRQWYVNTEGQTFVILNADKPFRMGSPDGEPDRVKDEVPHQQRIGRTFAIASKIVTKAQFRHFQEANPDVEKLDIEQCSRTDDSPQVAVDWYDAARYCNWLSKNEGIPKEQWCYEPNDQGKYAEGMKPAADYLQRSGYRLPTEAEWEYACRSGSQTSRYYGLSVKLLPKYAWFLDNSDNRAWPVGMKKPNDYGLFDMLGNAWEWCDNNYANYAVGSDGVALEDPGTPPWWGTRSTVCCVAARSTIKRRSCVLPTATPTCRRSGAAVTVSVWRGLAFETSVNDGTRMWPTLRGAWGFQYLDVVDDPGTISGNVRVKSLTLFLGGAVMQNQIASCVSGTDATASPAQRRSIPCRLDRVRSAISGRAAGDQSSGVASAAYEWTESQKSFVDQSHGVAAAAYSRTDSQ